MRQEKTDFHLAYLTYLPVPGTRWQFGAKSKIIFKESAEKYEFDFKNEMPLDSPNCKFEWHPVR